MSKKTKKEKILSAYRKKLRLLEQPDQKFSDLKAQVVIPNTISKEQPETKKTFQVPPPKHFFSDLRKSLFLITAIIALEIGLYFAKLIK